MYELEAAQVKEYDERLDGLRKCLNVDGTKTQIAGIEQEMAKPGFWDDPEGAQKVLQNLNNQKVKLINLSHIKSIENKILYINFQIDQREIVPEPNS